MEDNNLQGNNGLPGMSAFRNPGYNDAHEIEEGNVVNSQATPQSLSDAREKEPFAWPASRVIQWNKQKLEFPPDFEGWKVSTFRSIATPACVDLAVIKMPLTAMELLIFFPQHVNNHDLQDRLYQNGIKASFQAAIINWARGLKPPNFLRSTYIEGIVSQRRRRDDPYDLDTPCTNYTVSHFKFAPGNLGPDNHPIDYGLIDVTFGVHVDKWPTGIDAGPFTRAVRHAFLSENEGTMLSEVGAYAQKHGLGNQLDPAYSDQDFEKRYKGFAVKERRRMRVEVIAMGYTSVLKDF